jgi:hydrogenase expression/formation protein HypD
MKFSDEFRDKGLVQGLAEQIRRIAGGYGGTMTFMEVCGTHTMAIHQFALRSMLPPTIRLISGPGCPVCVTPNGYLDRAVALSRLSDVTIATFGDMLRVPGSTSSLMEERARGADVQVVYSPLDALNLAERNPKRRVVFLGVGFETTAPAVAGSIMAAVARGLDNYFVLAAHKTIPGAMELLADDPELALSGFICPAHVSVVIGADAYGALAKKHGMPCVITGFEPADVLQGVAMLANQVIHAEHKVEIQYRRAVKVEGNRKARQLINEVFTSVDAGWRGIGMIPGSGLAIAEKYAPFDAERMIPVEPEPLKEHSGCRCGDILKGKAEPFECPLFATACTPEEPVGACMVSSEGSCAAAFKYSL